MGAFYLHFLSASTFALREGNPELRSKIRFVQLIHTVILLVALYTMRVLCRKTSDFSWAADAFLDFNCITRYHGRDQLSIHVLFVLQARQSGNVAL